MNNIYSDYNDDMIINETAWAIFFPNDPEDLDFTFTNKRDAAREAMDIRDKAVRDGNTDLMGVGIIMVEINGDEIRAIDAEITDEAELRELAGEDAE